MHQHSKRRLVSFKINPDLLVRPSRREANDVIKSVWASLPRFMLYALVANGDSKVWHCLLQGRGHHITTVNELGYEADT